MHGRRNRKLRHSISHPRGFSSKAFIYYLRLIFIFSVRVRLGEKREIPTKLETSRGAVMEQYLQQKNTVRISLFLISFIIYLYKYYSLQVGRALFMHALTAPHCRL